MVPHQKYQVDKLEKVQRKAARFVKNCWIREEGVMTNMLSDLKWDSLQTRREKARLVMFYRVTHGLVDLSLIHISEPTNQRGSRMPSSA